VASRDPFYGTQAWKKIRAAVFARDGHRCKRCAALGKQRGGLARLTADHAGMPLARWVETGHLPETYPLRWIETLCDVCHGRKDGPRSRR
jgi:5-methylcytosine-specific restriction endonuclease McrA